MMVVKNVRYLFDNKKLVINAPDFLNTGLIKKSIPA